MVHLEGIPKILIKLKKLHQEVSDTFDPTVENDAGEPDGSDVDDEAKET